MMARTLVTAPSSEPLTTQEAKDHMGVTITDDDTRIDAFITAAREYVENVTNRALITQTWDLFRDTFPEVIEVPKAPLQSVTSITYTDTDGNAQTLASSVYTADTDSDPGRIYLAYLKSWPTIRSIRHAITIRIIAGYGAASAVPQPIKQAMLLLIGESYREAEASAPVTLAKIPYGVESLLAPYRIVGF